MMLGKNSFDLWQRPKLQVLSTQQLEKIYGASLEVLERTGTVIKHEGALEMLHGAGAYVEDHQRVKIPSYLVEEALRSVQKRVVIGDRNGEAALFLEGDEVYFGPGSETPYVLDPFTDKRREATKGDVNRAGRVIDYLPQIDFAMSFALATDVQKETADCHHFMELLSTTSKPILFTAWDAEGIDYIYQMACVAAGGKEKFQVTPFILHYAEPTSPLTHSTTTIDNLFACVERGIPLMYVPGASMGGTAPVTLAGGYVQSGAEFLTGLLLSQLKKPGSRVFYGGGVNPLDMKTMIFSYGAPEAWLSRVIRKELASFLGLPVFATGGCTDAKQVDEQAAMEAASSLMLSGLSGQNLVHDVGYIESGMTSSLEMLVLCNEIIATVRRILSSLSVNPETLALPVIQQVGPGGNYLGHEHTMEHFRGVLGEYPLLDRDHFQAWKKKGEKTLGQRVKEKTLDILQNHPGNPLPEDRQKMIEEIVAESDVKRKKKKRGSMS